jgi:predicted 3-demethylubiquinone-9 3-methyltransferase (glyoxalase superfamily)
VLQLKPKQKNQLKLRNNQKKTGNVLNIGSSITKDINTQTFVDPNWLRLTIIRNLQDQFEQYWHSLLDNASKAKNYRLFKDYFGMEVCYLKYQSILPCQNNL